MQQSDEIEIMKNNIEIVAKKIHSGKNQIVETKYRVEKKKNRQ